MAAELFSKLGLPQSCKIIIGVFQGRTKIASTVQESLPTVTKTRFSEHVQPTKESPPPGGENLGSLLGAFRHSTDGCLMTGKPTSHIGYWLFMNNPKSFYCINLVCEVMNTFSDQSAAFSLSWKNQISCCCIAHVCCLHSVQYC